MKHENKNELSKDKKKICKNCKLQNSCGDLPGFCQLIFYVPIIVVVAGLAYLLMTMQL